MNGRRRSIRRPLTALGAALLAASLAPASAVARTADSATPPLLAWSHAHSELVVGARAVDGDTWAIEAHVRDTSSGPVGGVSIEFVATVDFLGVRTLDLGSTRTDTSGTATLTYHPTSNGVHHIVAKAPFDDGVLVSNEAVIEVTGATPPLAAPAQRLPTVGAWAGPVAAIVVASIWGLLALVFVRVVVGISRATVVARGQAGRSFDISADSKG